MLKAHDYPHFLSSEIPNCPPDKSLFHVIPVPYENTISYGEGTKHGPSAILKASSQLELYDPYTQTIPAKHGIYTHNPVANSTFSMDNPETLFDKIAKATQEALELNALPVVLGGEHSISYGSLSALKNKYGRFGILHIDAHADLRDEYEGSIWSHACVMRRALDLDLKIAQFGTRAYCQEEDEVRKAYNIPTFDGHLFRDPRAIMPEGYTENTILPIDFPNEIYISFDVDGLDPSVIPHTGTPVPGGLQLYQSLDLLSMLLKGRTLIGFDVVELAPKKDSHVSDFATASLVYKLMGLAVNNKNLGIN